MYLTPAYTSGELPCFNMVISEHFDASALYFVCLNKVTLLDTIILSKSVWLIYMKSLFYYVLVIGGK